MKTYKLLLYVQLQEEDVAETSPIFHQETGMIGYTPDAGNVGEFVKEAIGSWGGSNHPYDPFFPTNLKVDVKECVELQNNRTMSEGTE